MQDAVEDPGDDVLFRGLQAKVRQRGIRRRHGRGEKLLTVGTLRASMLSTLSQTGNRTTRAGYSLRDKAVWQRVRTSMANGTKHSVTKSIPNGDRSFASSFGSKCVWICARYVGNSTCRVIIWGRTCGLHSSGISLAHLNASVHVTGGRMPARRPASQRSGVLPLRSTSTQWRTKRRPGAKSSAMPMSPGMASSSKRSFEAMVVLLCRVPDYRRDWSRTARKGKW